MKTSSSLFTLAVSSAALLTSSLVDAQEWSFQPRVNVGIMDYEYKQEDLSTVRSFTVTDPVTKNQVTVLESTSLQGVKRSDWLPYIGIGGTVSYDRFFIDIYGFKTATGEQKGLSQYSFINQSVPFSNFSETSENFVKGDSDIDRSQYSISIGYNVIDNLVVYTGYRESKTDFDNKLILSGYTTGLVNEQGSKLPLEFIPPTAVTLNQEFKQRGPFIGAAYGWNIMDKGIFSLNFSVGSFRGTIKESWSLNQGKIPVPEVSGDVIGLTLGASWRGEITDNLGYSVAVSGYNFSYDSDNNNSANFSEKEINFSAGLSYRF